jgi:hypothetical protein
MNVRTLLPESNTDTVAFSKLCTSHVSRIIDISVYVIIKIVITRPELLNVLTCSVFSSSEIGFTRMGILP